MQRHVPDVIAILRWLEAKMIIRGVYCRVPFLEKMIRNELKINSN
jgi:hypothetical protein